MSKSLWHKESKERYERKKTPLLGKTLGELKTIVQDLGMPKFTAGQIASWLYDKKVGSIEEMTNLSLKNRERLMENYEVGASAPVHEMRSVDGTVKYLFCTPEGDYIESVYIPDDDRGYFVRVVTGGMQDELQILYYRESRDTRPA